MSKTQTLDDKLDSLLDLYKKLKDEEHAESNNWSDAQKLRFFPDRLKGEAKQCHAESKNKVRVGNAQDPPFSYAVWRADLIERFRNNKDIEQIRQHLNGLRQNTDQRTRAFVARLNKLYASVYGKDPETPTNPNENEAVAIFPIRFGSNQNRELKAIKALARPRIRLSSQLSTLKLKP